MAGSPIADSGLQIADWGFPLPRVGWSLWKLPYWGPRVIRSHGSPHFRSSRPVVFQSPKTCIAEANRPHASHSLSVPRSSGPAVFSSHGPQSSRATDQRIDGLTSHPVNELASQRVFLTASRRALPSGRGNRGSCPGRRRADSGGRRRGCTRRARPPARGSPCTS